MENSDNRLIVWDVSAEYIARDLRRSWVRTFRYGGLWNVSTASTKAYPPKYRLSNQQMGFFNKLGREVEQFKQNAKAAADESAEYQCQACDARFHTEYDECPECGAQEVSVRSSSE